MGLVLSLEFTRINTKSPHFSRCLNYHTQILHEISYIVSLTIWNHAMLKLYFVHLSFLPAKVKLVVSTLIKKTYLVGLETIPVNNIESCNPK